MKNITSFKMFESYLDHNGKDVGIEGGETVIRKRDGKKGTIARFKYSPDETSTTVIINLEGGAGVECPLNVLLDDTKYEIQRG